MKRQTVLFFYILGAYVVLQFIWWGYHLIDLSQKVADTEEQIRTRVLMIIGEGSVFFFLLLIGLWRVRSSIKKDLQYSQRQSNFLLSVTHELKTPLASNKLYLQTLLKHYNLPPEKQEKLIQQALHENNRLEDMIENILTATRIENHHLEVHKSEINLSELIRETAQKWAEQRINLHYEITENITLIGDAFILSTALTNLLENALKYNPENTHISVYLKEDDNKIIFGVKDQGIGVPEKYRSAVFDRFTRIGNEETRTQKGTGLGLYIVAELLKLHEATIKCLPNTPKGANFQITLYDNE